MYLPSMIMVGMVLTGGFSLVGQEVLLKDSEHVFLLFIEQCMNFISLWRVECQEFQRRLGLKLGQWCSNPKHLILDLLSVGGSKAVILHLMMPLLKLAMVSRDFPKLEGVLGGMGDVQSLGEDSFPSESGL